MLGVSSPHEPLSKCHSTLTCLLALHLAQRRSSRVLAIDLDNQRNLSHTLRQYRVEIPSLSLFEDPPITLPSVTESIVVLSGTPQLANMERASTAEAQARVRRFTTHLESFRDRFEYCLLDPPPTLGIRMVAALASANYVAMPIELEEYSTQGVKDMLQTVFGARQKWNPRLKFVGIIANRFMSNSVRQKVALQELLTHYSHYVLPGKISTRSAIPRALEAGVGIWDLPASSARDASAEVIHVFEALIKGMESHSTTGPET